MGADYIFGKKFFLILSSNVTIQAGQQRWIGPSYLGNNRQNTDFRIPFPCVMSLAYFKCNPAPGAGENVTFNIMNGAVLGNLTGVIADLNVTAEDLVNTDAFAVGDPVSMRCVASGACVNTIIGCTLVVTPI